MRPDKFMPMYWGDYLRDTGHLSAAEHGGYLLLIGHYWTTGKPLPTNEEALRRIARLERSEWEVSRDTILAFFALDGDCYRHHRIDAELAKALEKYERRANAGRKGNEKRWGASSQSASQCDPNASRPDIANTSQPQPQPHSPNGEEDGVVNARATGSAKAVIKAFDNARATAYGEEHRRPYPQAKDMVIAQRWLDAGADLDLCGEVFRQVFHDRAGRGQPPPSALAYFDQPIADALATRNRPMPEGRPNDEHRGHQRPPQRSGNGFLNLRQQEPGSGARDADDGDDGWGGPTLDLAPTRYGNA